MSLPLQPIPLDALRHSKALWLVAYWRSKIARDELPHCDTISASEMRSVALDLMMLEPTEAGDGLRYRMVGAAIGARFGTDLVGKTLHLESAGGWAAAYSEALETRRPAALRGWVAGEATRWAHFEAVLLPLDGPREGAVSILAGMFFFDD